MRWYHAFHSRMRSVSIALMKSHDAVRGGDADLLRADAVHLGNREVRQLIVGAVVARLQLVRRQHAVAIGVDAVERLGQQAAVRLRRGRACRRCSRRAARAAAGRGRGIDLQAAAGVGVAADAPCAFAHRMTGIVHVGQPLLLPSAPGYVCSFRLSRQTWPSACEPKPLTSMSYLMSVSGSLRLSAAGAKNCR